MTLLLLNNRRGVIPVIFLVLIGIAAGFVGGMTVQKKIINQTMICHEPGK